LNVVSDVTYDTASVGHIAVLSQRNATRHRPESCPDCIDDRWLLTDQFYSCSV